MKVLTFSSLYPNNIWPQLGIFIKERMTHFAALKDCEVKVIAPVPYFPPLKLGHRFPYSQVRRRETIEGIDVYHPRYFMIPKVSMVWHGVMMFLAVLPLAYKLRQAYRFDVIDAHFVYPDGLAAVLLGHAFNTPVVVSARGSDINLYRQLPLINRWLRYTLKRSERVIAVSQALKAAISQLGIASAKVAVIPNGVDPNKFFPYSRQEARRKLGLGDGRLLLSVGNLNSNKGFDLLLESFKALRRDFHDLSLVIVGEGALRKRLEEQIAALDLQPWARLVGAAPHDALHLWYNAANLFCLASVREGWPNVLLEALACGTPVVATEVGGIPEIVTSREVGFLAKRSEQALVTQLACALRQDWQREPLVRYAQQHTWDAVAQSVLQVFELALKNRDLPQGQHALN